MKKLLCTAAAIAFLSTSAFAASSALDVRTKMMSYNESDPSIVDILMDEQGNDREESDFMARMTAATPDQQKMLMDACTKAQEEKVTFSDMVQARCKIASGN